LFLLGCVGAHSRRFAAGSEVARVQAALFAGHGATPSIGKDDIIAWLKTL
jgi:hypothetical protein